MTARAPEWYRLPHPLTFPPLASGIYWRATCDCHCGQVVGLNHFATRASK